MIFSANNLKRKMDGPHSGGSSSTLFASSSAKSLNSPVLGNELLVLENEL